MTSHRRVCVAFVAAIVGAGVLVPAAFAQEAGDPGFEPPRAPAELEPVLSGSFHLSVFAPLETTPVCPAPGDCVMQGGGGIGATIERRWPFGPSVGLGYELIFVDANGVFELGVIQELRAQASYRFLPDSLVHPFFGGGIGALVFGDTFSVATAGVSVMFFAGIELELTEVFSLWASVPVRLFLVDAFTTERDGIARAEDGGLNVTSALQLGLSITELR